MTSTASLAASVYPASFSFLFDADGEQVGDEGATLAHDSVDRAVVYSVEVEEYLDGYRTTLAFLDDLDRVVFTHTMDRDGPLPKLTVERARSEAEFVIEHAAENAAARGEASTVLVDGHAVWGVRPEFDIVDAARAFDIEIVNKPRGCERVYESEIRNGRQGYVGYRVPTAIADTLEAKDHRIAALFPVCGCVAFVDVRDDEQA